MKIKDCYWEKANLGSDVVEVEMDAEDVFRPEDFLALDEKYDYQVIKVPNKRVDINLGLSAIGYSFIESLLSISMRVKDFPYDSKVVKYLSKHYHIKHVETEEQLQHVLDSIEPNMFATDRITLDPHYGPEVGCNRYRNWVRTSFYEGKNYITESYFDDDCIGFGMVSFEGKTMHGLLGGVYSNTGDITGLGIMNGAGAFIEQRALGFEMDMERTVISTNNMPVVQVYNYLGYKVDKIQNVFIKHIDRK